MVALTGLDFSFVPDDRMMVKMILVVAVKEHYARPEPCERCHMNRVLSFSERRKWRQKESPLDTAGLDMKTLFFTCIVTCILVTEDKYKKTISKLGVLLWPCSVVCNCV
jgi:hypothetical protein